MTRVLVTGAGGFIGGKLLQVLPIKNYDVIGWDRAETNKKNKVKIVDLNCKEDVLDALDEAKPDIIIHCAGSANVAESVKFPEVDLIGNVNTTHNMLFSMQKLKMNNVRFVFLSSAGVYGNPVSLPVKESDLCRPMSPYALHKKICEEICLYFVHNYKFDIKIARIFSAYGPGLKKQIFWDMYQKVKQNGRLDMFGTGKESRDFIYIDDLINALLLIAESDTGEIVYNIANGTEIKIENVAKIYADCLQIGLEKVLFNGTEREGDPKNWVADVSLLKRLGYCSKTKIDEGIKKYIDWIKENNL